jgi:hypothetical protein
MTAADKVGVGRPKMAVQSSRRTGKVSPGVNGLAPFGPAVGQVARNMPNSGRTGQWKFWALCRLTEFDSRPVLVQSFSGAIRDQACEPLWN